MRLKATVRDFIVSGMFTPFRSKSLSERKFDGITG